jgi:hypothetical protein
VPGPGRGASTIPEIQFGPSSESRANAAASWRPARSAAEERGCSREAVSHAAAHLEILASHRNPVAGRDRLG